MVTLILVLLAVVVAIAASAYSWVTIEKLADRLEETRYMAMESHHWLNVHGRDVEELLKRQKDTWHREG